MPKGYVIVRVNVTDMEQYKEYMALSPGAIAAAGGKFLVRGGQNETLEGEPETRRIVMLEFPDYETAKGFYDTELYQEAKAKREGAAQMQAVVVEGAPEG